MKNFYKTTLINLLLLSAILVTTYLVYANGLTGATHFDDTPNLQGLSGINSLDSAIPFIFGGNAGPLGRPIALASFALQAPYWPTEFRVLLKVNILIHLINCLLVAWFALRLSRVAEEEPNNEVPFALSVSALWGLHPLLISSSLITIQRMTTLSSTFMLAGFILYLIGRKNIKTHTKSACTLMLSSVIIVTPIAGFTKETGLLFPIYLWALEFTLFCRQENCNFLRAWRKILALPVLALILYLASFIPNAADVSPRGFSGWQRLLAEGPVLLTYLKLILVPTPNAFGPFHDDIEIPSSTSSVIYALGAWGVIIASIAYGVRSRRKFPWLSFAIIWFFIGQSLESTLPSLELYFEHRNYIPILGPIVLFSSTIWCSTGKFSRVLRISLPICLALFCFISVQVTHLWGNPALSAEVWSLEHPRSERAYQFLAQRYISIGEEKKARDVIMSGYFLLPYSAGLSLQSLQMSCNVEGQIDTDITNILNSLQQSVQNYAAVDAIKALLETNKNGSCKGLTNEVLHTIIDTLLSNQNFKSNPRISFNLHQFKSLLYFQQRELDPAVQHLEVAFSISPDIDTASMIVYYLTTAGLMDEALQSIQHFSSSLPYNPVLRKQWTLRLKAMEHEIRNRLSNMPST